MSKSGGVFQIDDVTRTMSKGGGGGAPGVPPIQVQTPPPTWLAGYGPVRPILYSLCLMTYTVLITPIISPVLYSLGLMTYRINQSPIIRPIVYSLRLMTYRINQPPPIIRPILYSLCLMTYRINHPPFHF